MTTVWNLVGFHDARIRAIVQTSDMLAFALADLYLFPEHPDNTTGRPLALDCARLVFSRPQATIVRAYTSATNHWMNLTPPFPQIDSIAEVIIDDMGGWLITGFARDGRWLEWAIQVGDAPYSET